MKIAKQLPTKTDSKLKDNVRFEHPAFGMISVSETCGGDSVLFGSDVDHTYKICLRNHTACMERGLNSDWYHDQKTMIEVDMTHQQFSMLQGSVGKQGVPCTMVMVCCTFLVQSFFIVIYAILESVVPQSRPKSISGEYRSYTLMAIALAITVGFVKYVL